MLLWASMTSRVEIKRHTSSGLEQTQWLLPCQVRSVPKKEPNTCMVKLELRSRVSDCVERRGLLVDSTVDFLIMHTASDHFNPTHYDIYALWGGVLRGKMQFVLPETYAVWDLCIVRLCIMRKSTVPANWARLWSPRLAWVGPENCLFGCGTMCLCWNPRALDTSKWLSRNIIHV
jgi:hypothetical protein